MSAYGTPAYSQAIAPSRAFIAAAIALLAGSSTGLFLTIVMWAEETIVAPAWISNDKHATANILLAILFCFTLCLCTLGIATAAGLLRFRSWARTSALVLGGLLAPIGAIGLFFVGVAISISHSSSRSRTVVFFITAGWFLCTCGMGIWHLVLLNQPRIRAQFRNLQYAWNHLSPAQIASLPSFQILLGVPVGVVLIACYTLTAIPLDFISIGRSDPTLMFNHVFFAPSAKAILLGLCALRVVAAIGLLQIRRWGYYLALAIQGFVMADCLTCLLSPTYEDRVRDMVTLIPRLALKLNLNVYPFRMRIFSAFSAILAGLVFTLLCRYRKYFINSGTAGESDQTPPAVEPVISQPDPIQAPQVQLRAVFANLPGTTLR